MSHPPATPAKVPASAATYTPATLDPDLRAQINSLLLREGHATKIQEHFLHSLNAHSSNWPSTIQAHALALLRSDEISTFPALVRRVLEDVQRDTATAAATIASNNANENGGKDGANGSAAAAGVNGTSKTNGSAAAAAAAAAGADSTPNLAIPPSVLEAVLKVVRDSLEDVCEIGSDGSAGG
ncbi:hypothetical protein F4808DRAFT_460854 [Astrocystis sublimbata]|nr:hypothetical protein F4808DRAFT_460854 [Astrocystis sublimbata]